MSIEDRLCRGGRYTLPLGTINSRRRPAFMEGWSMPSNRTRRRPAPEVLEDRLALSNGLPGNDLAVATGAVGAAGQVAEVSVTIPATAFGNRQSIIIGVE